jgi:hypothetical protein
MSGALPIFFSRRGAEAQRVERANVSENSLRTSAPLRETHSALRAGVML